MMKHLFPIPAVLALASAGLQAGSLQVTAVRAWSFPDVTRVAIEVNGDFTYHQDRAHNPERLFFDLQGAVPKIGGHRLMNKEIGDRLLKRVRVAETQPDVTRVVLDLETPVEFIASQLSSPDRLIVELRPVLATKPAGPPITDRVPAIITSAPPPLAAPVATETPLSASPLNTVAKADAPPAPDPDTLARPAVARKGKKPREAAIPETFSAASTARAAEVKQQLPAPPVVEPTAHSAAIDSTHSLTRALGLKVNRIVIDAGHGGHDQGTSGPGGLLEKDVVLDVALRLGKLIEERMNAEVIYTRSDDTFIPLQERTAIANRNHADLFLSIHANSSPAADVVGVETYYLNFTDSPDSTNVAARENAMSQASVFELKDLIGKISLHDKLEESKQFADSVQTSMQSFTAKSFPKVRNRGVRKAPFVVLIGASMPSILAEIGFLTNRREENLLARPDYRQKLAEALYKGMHRYTQTLSHFEMAKGASALNETAPPLAAATR